MGEIVNIIGRGDPGLARQPHGRGRGHPRQWCMGRAAVPSGGLHGRDEAVELRDGGARFHGKGVQPRWGSSTARSPSAAPGSTALEQRLIDTSSTRWTARPTRPVWAPTRSWAPAMAVAKAAADDWICPCTGTRRANAHVLPVPMMKRRERRVHARQLDRHAGVHDHARSGAQLPARRCAGAPRRTTR